MTAFGSCSDIGLLAQPRVVRVRRSILWFFMVSYILLLPYQFKVGTLINFAPADCFLAVGLLFGAGQLIYRPSAWSFWHLGVMLTFVLGSLMSAWRHGTLESYELLNKDLGLVLPFLSYLACTSVVVGWGDVRRILRLFVLTVVFENLIAVAAYLLGYFLGISTSFVRYDGLRLSGMLLDPNAYGGLLAAALVIAEASSTGRRPLFRGFTLLLIRTSLALGLLFTFSRSAWLGLMFALLIFCLTRPGRLFKAIASVAAGIPVVIILMGGRFIPIVQEMSKRPEQVQERFDLIQQALGAFQRYPFLGGGLGSFRLSAGEIAHNSAMWFLADFGLVGLGVLAGFLAWFFKRAWIAYRTAPETERPLALGLLLAHAALTGLAMGIEAFYQRHWWIVMALIASVHSFAVETSRRKAMALNLTGGNE
jgi:hypothetical protein